MSELFGEINPLLILVMLPGLVQFLKELFSLEGKIVTALSMLLGVALSVLLQLQSLYPVLNQWFSLSIYGILFGLTASGYYKLSRAG